MARFTWASTPLGGAFAYEGAHGCLRGQRVAQLYGAYLIKQLFQEFIMYTAVDYEPFRYRAYLPGHVEGATGRGLCDGAIYIRVSANYHRGVSAELEALVFEVASAVFRHALTGSGASGEVNACYAVVRGQPFADGLTATRYALIGIAREAGLIHQLG